MMIIAWVVMPIVCMIADTIYLYRKIIGGVSCFLPDWTKKKQRILAGILAAALIIPAIRIYGIWFIILLHLTVILLVVDGIVLIVKKVRKINDFSKVWNRIYRSGIVAVILTAIVCGYGRYNIFHVVRTEYTIQTQKNIQTDGYRIVLLSDLHYGVSLDDSGLQKVVERINDEKADIVVLDGDIVDESTTVEQMESAFRILGQINSTYGIYYVYGNHDQNNYATRANYTKEKLADTIKNAGIQILEDETTVINKEVVLIGRADRGDGTAKRKDIVDLVENLNPKQEWIVLDHQTAEYEKVKNAGGDMILSGHTHAGQIWPAGLLASLFHFDELNYGEKSLENLHAVVTSGIAGWGYPIRTEKHSEYVVLNVIPQK